MQESDDITAAIKGILRSKLVERMDAYTFPPPVFFAMEGEFVALDLEADSLTVRFPVRERYLNPYDTMQGGMIAAAVDNTVGPLSVLIAPPNVTPRLEMTYGRPVTPDMGHVVVSAPTDDAREFTG